MKKNGKKLMVFGTRKPAETKKNILIKKAVRKAIHDYKKAYERLAYE